MERINSILAAIGCYYIISVLLEHFQSLGEQILEVDKPKGAMLKFVTIALRIAKYMRVIFVR